MNDMEWQSIKMAPKDARILVYIPYIGAMDRGRVVDVFWGHDINGWKNCRGKPLPSSSMPTHWLLKIPNRPIDDRDNE